MFARFVNVVEILAAVAAAVFVVYLFANDPTTSGAAASPGGRVFQASCATCHGADGGGGFGPKLSGGAVVRDFPNASAQIDFVTHGRGSMPAFGNQLTPTQIRQVVEYTRTGLGK